MRLDDALFFNVVAFRKSLRSRVESGNPHMAGKQDE